MNNRWTIIFFMILICFAGDPVAVVEAADQIRWKNSIRYESSDEVTITATYENRFNDLTVFDEHFLSAYYVTVTYKVKPAWYTAFGFRRQDTDMGSFTSHENRVYFQGGRKLRFAEHAVLDTRGRIEYRTYREPILDDYFRFRLRFAVSYATGFGALRLTPFISDELFADDRAGGGEFLNRSRILMGVGVPIGSRVRLEANYMLQNDRDTRPLTALGVGVQIGL